VGADGGAARRRRAGWCALRRLVLRSAADRRLRHAARDFRAARARDRLAVDHHPLPCSPPRHAAVVMDIITPFLMQSAVQAITPILLAALAGVLCGRVGVFNMALEGQMLIGAFAAIVGSYFLGSATGGILVAVVAVVIFSSILAYGATVFRGD